MTWATEFDHPCKETCSGWKQGFDRGVETSKKQIDELTKMNSDGCDLLAKEMEQVARLRGSLRRIQLEYANELAEELPLWFERLTAEIDVALSSAPEPTIVEIVRKLVKTLRSYENPIHPELTREDVIKFDRAMARYALEETKEAREALGL